MIEVMFYVYGMLDIRVRPNRSYIMKTKAKQELHDHVDHSLPRTLEATEMLKPSFSKRLFQDLMNVKKNRADSERLISRMSYFIGLSVSLLACIVVINWKTYDRLELIDLGQVEADFDDLMEVPISEQPPPPPPKEMQTAVIVEVSDEELIEEIEFQVDAEMTEEAQVEDHNIDFTVEATVEEESVEEVFTIVETYPAPVGGFQSFYEYVAKNIQYPAQARRLSIEGMVFVQFVVEKDGAITNIQVLKGIGAGCDKEAVRVLENAPPWKPGKQRGRNVRVYMTVPIRFILQS